ncbi:MAG: hypothetical protein KatS3mg115_1645 [Candidatus Poribacteria bacterium]|nr:MAG: hypothetical protein KatS3mg115_1645 [Candidatus Poribacteria bacterium]
MEQMDPEAVGLNWDASHIWRTPEHEDPVESLRALKQYVATLRIRDTLSRERPIGPVETQIPAAVRCRWPRSLQEMQTIPQVRYAVLEIVGTKDFSLEQVDDVARRSYEGLIPYFSA